MTLSEIKEAKPGQTLWDSVIKGLHLRVRDSGKKHFYLFYRAGPIQRKPKLGEFGQITLAEARKMAKDILSDVDRGLDPSGERTKKRKEITMTELWEETLLGHYSQKRYVDSGHKKLAELAWKNHLSAPFGKLTPSSIGHIMIRTWHNKLASQPAAAYRSKAILSRIFRYGLENGLIAPTVNPCSLVKSFPMRTRSRYAAESEIKLIMDALVKYEKDFPHAVAFIRTTFYTGSRLKGLENIPKSDLRLVEKNGKKFGVVLFTGKTTYDSGNEEMLVFPPQIIDEVLALAPTNDGTLFGTKYPRWLWRKIKIETGITGLWARDSRRTFATKGFSNGVEKGVVGNLLNHASAQTTDIYAKLMIDSKLDAVEKIADQFEETLKDKNAIDEGNL